MQFSNEAPKTVVRKAMAIRGQEAPEEETIL